MAIPGGMDDEPVAKLASTVADVKEADMDYSFLAGKRRAQEMDKWGDIYQFWKANSSTGTCQSQPDLLG